jgi:hypothetical protein
MEQAARAEVPATLPGSRRGDAGALARAARQAAPVTLAGEQVLEVVPALREILPSGLTRGSVVRAEGAVATSLALTLAAGPSQAGSWTGVVGLPSLGLQAAGELGVALERLLLVAPPGPGEWPTVVATLLDGVDVVLVAPPRGLRATDGRRLAARARDRGAVLVLVGSAAEPEAELVVSAEATWEGLEPGAGHLRARLVRLTAHGRRAAARPRRAAVWLPDHEGRVRAHEPGAPVVPLRPAAAG